jgi:hypothetical protein
VVIEPIIRYYPDFHYEKVQEDLEVKGPIYLMNLRIGFRAPSLRLFLFCGLFNEAVSSSHYIASNNWIINKRRIGKNVEGRGHGLILYTLPVFGCKD